ncbi:MAG: tRNA-guanine transglycosylase, partial [Brevibacterium yomogidense]
MTETTTSAADAARANAGGAHAAGAPAGGDAAGGDTAGGDTAADRTQFGFDVGTTMSGGGRTGTIRTPHGTIATPAFIPVGTKATVKAVKPEDVDALGADAVLANAYHLFLQPGADIVDEAGGLGAFMNWPGPTYTDSGGFQVM